MSMIKVTDERPIVFVEDDEVQTIFIQRYYQLIKAENKLVIFHSGVDFLRYIKTLDPSSDSFPSLIVMDINMPGLTGFETLERLRSMDEFKVSPPTLMYTSSTNPRDREMAFEYGADDFANKPISPKDFTQLFRKILTAA